MGQDLEREQHLGLLDSLPWLDASTAALVKETARALADHHEVDAVILFGSVARHEERPLDDDEPSDVDLLALVDPGLECSRLPLHRTLAIHGTIGRVAYEHGDTPREVQVTIAQVDLADWDVTFVENIARDGILLWARGPLPPPIEQLTSRASAVPGLQP